MIFTIELLRSLLIIFVIGLFISVYEYSIFYFILVPEVREELNNSFAKPPDTISNKDIEELKEGIFAYIKAASQSEQTLVKSINDSTIISAITMIVVLCICISFIIYGIYSKGFEIGLHTWSIIFYSILLILLFQGLFYAYGRSYKFVEPINGSFPVEYKYEIYNKIKEAFKDE